MALIKWGSINAAGDITMAAIVNQSGTQTRTAVRELIEALTPGIIADSPTVTAAARVAVDGVLAGYFIPDVNTGLVTFPNGTSPGSVFGQVFAIAPSSIAAGTPNFHDMPTTSGTNVIKVRSTGSLSQWGNSLTPGGQRVTAGSAITLATVEVGNGEGVNRTRIGSLTGGSGAKSMGGIVAAQFNSNDFKYFRWVIGASGNYALQRYSGGNLENGTVTTLLSTNVIAQSNDLVDLKFDRRDGLLSLTVNGAVIGVWSASTEVRASHATATHAGMWMLAEIGNSNYFGGWQWLADYASGTMQRRLVSATADGTMLPGVKLDPAQKRQVVGPVFDIRDYGAKCDGIYLTDARTSAGTDYVWSTSRNFTSSDIGKRIAVGGGGTVIANANDGVLLGTIASIDGTAARIGTVATTTVTGARSVFGTTDDLAIAKAQKDAVRAGGGTVYFPPGRTIVTSPLNVENFVSWKGYSRNLSWVHVLQDNAGSASVAGNADWLTCAGRTASTPLIGARFEDFGVNAEFHFHSGGYGTAMKPLNIYYVQRCSIERMNVWNTPATAVPFDHSFDQVTIRDNYILNPGRLAPSGVGPGGSGIGAGTKATGATEPTLIENNVIVGTHSATVAGPGHNGIFTEAQTGADPDAGVPGYRIVNNVIIGMPNGISDTGSTGTVISGNEIIGCGNGIRLAKTTLPDAYPGLHANIFGNTIRGCTGPDTFDGVGVRIFMPDATAANLREYLHTLITGNQIFECKSWGVSVSAPSGAIDITGIVIQGNVIRANGRSGVRLFAGSGRKLRYLAVRDNQLVGNGRRAIAGDRAGVLVESGTTLDGGRIQDNDIYDLASSPTQTDVIVTTGATLTGVRRSGNTGDA